MESIEQSLRFEFNARYYVLGDLGKAKEAWFVLHGYGQLVQYFIKKFSSLQESGICVIAPEGLSRFYLKGNRGRVGATWMTSENRLMDIQNYIAYLNAVFLHQMKDYKLPTTVLGFSQGAATAMRWVMDGTVSFDRLILWAGLFPPDIDFAKGAELLHEKKIIEVLGTQDEFINQDRVAEMHRLNNLLRISPTIIQFEGKHEIDQNVLEQIANKR
ncbi:MAG: alpha/beta hydrolase [Flammeovirgaceae bacterium]